MRNILAIAALSTALAATSLAYAQTTSSTTDNSPSVSSKPNNSGDNGQDAPDYLTGPSIHRFYTDEQMTTLRPIGEIRTVYTGMDPQEQLRLTRACASNQDTRFADLCTSVGTF